MSSMFAGPQPAPAPPSAPDPIRIPNPSDPDVMQARKNKANEEFGSRRGRESTRLTPPDQAYSRTTLG